MKLDIGVNVLTLPFEVNTLTIGPSGQEFSYWKSHHQILSCDLKIGVMTGNVLYFVYD